MRLGRILRILSLGQRRTVAPLALAGLLLYTFLIVGCTSSSVAPESDVLSEFTADELIESTTEQVSVYYPAADTIIEEQVVLDDDADALYQVLTMMFGKRTLDTGAIVTLPRAEVLGVRVRDGIATVDFSREVLGIGESEQVQYSALISIIYAATQFPEVDQVAFTVEGKTEGVIDGNDIETFWGTVTLADMPWSAQVGERTEEGSAQ